MLKPLPRGLLVPHALVRLHAIQDADTFCTPARQAEQAVAAAAHVLPASKCCALSCAGSCSHTTRHASRSEHVMAAACRGSHAPREPAPAAAGRRPRPAIALAAGAQPATRLGRRAARRRRHALRRAWALRRPWALSRPCALPGQQYWGPDRAAARAAAGPVGAGARAADTPRTARAVPALLACHGLVAARAWWVPAGTL